MYKDDLNSLGEEIIIYNTMRLAISSYRKANKKVK